MEEILELLKSVLGLMNGNGAIATVIVILLGLIGRYFEKNVLKKKLNSNWNKVLDKIQDEIERFQTNNVEQNGTAKIDTNRVIEKLRNAKTEATAKPEKKKKGFFGLFMLLAIVFFVWSLSSKAQTPCNVCPSPDVHCWQNSDLFSIWCALPGGGGGGGTGNVNITGNAVGLATGANITTQTTALTTATTNQTTSLNAATTAQTTALSTALSNQTTSLVNSISGGCTNCDIATAVSNITVDTIHIYNLLYEMLYDDVVNNTPWLQSIWLKENQILQQTVMLNDKSPYQTVTYPAMTTGSSQIMGFGISAITGQPQVINDFSVDVDMDGTSGGVAYCTFELFGYNNSARAGVIPASALGNIASFTSYTSAYNAAACMQSMCKVFTGLAYTNIELRCTGMFDNTDTPVAAETVDVTITRKAHL